MKITEPTIFDDSVVAGVWFPAPSETEIKGVGAGELVVLRQLHGDLIQEVERGLLPAPDGDALITHEPGLLLAIRVADCVAVLIHDPQRKVVAAVHSGWRGTKAAMAAKLIKRLRDQFESDPAKLHAYISPSGQACCYEVGEEFKDHFPSEYFEKRAGKLYFDNSQLVFDQLVKAGVKHENIEYDKRCTIDDPSFPSHRRDKTKERMFVAIGLKVDL